MKVFANKDPHTSFNIRPADLRRLLLNPPIKQRRTMLHLNLLFPTRKHSNTLIGFLLVSRIFSKQKLLFVSFSNSELKEKKKSSCIFGTQLLFQENWLWKKKKKDQSKTAQNALFTFCLSVPVSHRLLRHFTFEENQEGEIQLMLI